MILEFYCLAQKGVYEYFLHKEYSIYTTPRNKKVKFIDVMVCLTDGEC